MPDSSRLIKKYPNRRLYDPKTSAYITLSDIRALVVAGEPFRVVDAKSGADLTRGVLLQIFLEGEEKTACVLASGAVARLICAQARADAGLLAQPLDQTVSAFLAGARGAFASEPVAPGKPLAQPSLSPRDDPRRTPTAAASAVLAGV